MTLDLAAIEARAAAATAGPWEEMDGYIMQPYAGGWCVLGTAHHGTQGTPAFIAHAREDIPALLAAVRTLEAERDEQRRVVIDSVHWQRAAESRAEAAERRVTALEELLAECQGEKP